MPDISQLLQAATHKPATGPDLVAVTARARVLLRRQRVGRASVAAVAILVIPAVAHSWRGGSDALQQLQPATPDVDATATRGPTPTAVRSAGPALPLRVGAAVSPSPGSSGGTGRTPAGSVTAQPAPRVQPSSVQSPTPRQSTAPPPTGTYSPAPSCSVSSTGLLPGTSQSCRFTATATGGWSLKLSSGTHTSGTELGFVDVYRDGRTTRYDAWKLDKRCRNDDVRPGDLVTVTIKQDDQGYADFEVGAGSGWACRN